MANDCPRFAAIYFIAVLALSGGAQCFVAQSPLCLAGVRQPQQQQQQQQQQLGHETSAPTHSSNKRRWREGARMMAGEGYREGAVGPSPEGPVGRKQALSKAWNAAFSLATLGAATAVSGGAAPAEAGVGEAIGEFLLPSQTEVPEIDIGDVDKEISYEDFERGLLKGEVMKCEFFGSNFNKAVVVLKDGTRALIGEGYPEDRAFSDDSPMKVVGLLRNAGVPFTTQFNTRKYAKPKSYKSAETLQAENRQKSEDEALELLMAK